MPKILGSLGSAQLWNVSQVESSRRGRSKRKPTKPQCVPGLVGFTRVQRGQGKGGTYLVAGILLLFAYGILGCTLLGLSSFHLTERPPPSRWQCVHTLGPLSDTARSSLPLSQALSRGNSVIAVIDLWLFSDCHKLGTGSWLSMADNNWLTDLSIVCCEVRKLQKQRKRNAVSR